MIHLATRADLRGCDAWAPTEETDASRLGVIRTHAPERPGPINPLDRLQVLTSPHSGFLQAFLAAT